MFKFAIHLFVYDINFQGNDGVVVENHDNSTSSEHDPHFEPVITLPEVTLSTMEEDEVEMIKLLVFTFFISFFPEVSNCLCFVRSSGIVP
jgi:hypothetical protein